LPITAKNIRKQDINPDNSASDCNDERILCRTGPPNSDIPLIDEGSNIPLDVDAVQTHDGHDPAGCTASAVDNTDIGEDALTLDGEKSYTSGGDPDEEDRESIGHSPHDNQQDIDEIVTAKILQT
jgi:hypothetical protein